MLLGRGDGTVVRLGNVAEVRDDFQDADLIVRHDGLPAVVVEVSRAEGEKVMNVARAARDHVADEVAPSLPDGVGITIWNDESGFGIAMILIFALLVVPLRSYTKPFIIMAVIPFGLIGVILGHRVLGVALSSESFIRLFGLAGVGGERFPGHDRLHRSGIRGGPPGARGARAVLGPVAVDRAAGRGAHGHREGDPVAAGAISPP